MADREDDVRTCVRDPDVIRSSAKDPDVHLYYRTRGKMTFCVVVGGEDPDSRFVVTAYLTKRAKRGPELWTK